MSENGKKPKRVLFRLMKGLIYGSVIGMVSAQRISVGFSREPVANPLPWSPSAQWAAFFFGASVVAGTASNTATGLKAMSKLSILCHVLHGLIRRAS